MLEELYPTPPELIEKMVEPFLFKSSYYWQSVLRDHVWLDPSAGNGAILDWLKEHRVVAKNLLAVEIDSDLRTILIKKGHTIIDYDWLNYTGDYSFDAVLMNPPFSNGDDHLLHAWNVLHHGDIVCVLNAETIRNPYTHVRKAIIALIEQHGTVEEIGQPFLNAERPTAVECVLVRLHKPAPAKGDEWQGLNLESEAEFVETEFSENALATPDVIASLVRQYNMMRGILEERARLASKYRFYAKGIMDVNDWGKDDNLDSLRSKFWQFVFRKTRIGEVTTSNFIKDFDEFALSTRNVAFTVANVRTVLTQFMDNQDAIVKRCIDDTFNALTMYYHGNRATPEGWKHNRSWWVARRIVIPDVFSWTGSFAKRNLLDDLDKCICFVTGTPLAGIVKLSDATDDHKENRRGTGVAYDSTWFEAKYFQKKTMHLYWRDEDAWQRFNIAASEGRNWLPDEER